MKTSVKTITPTLARSMLDEHERRLKAGFKQRNVYPRVVEKYAEDMRSGNWVVTGQGITLDIDGNLLDGQHRLYAICKANVPIDLLVVEDVPAMANNTPTINRMDIGRPRSLASQLSIDGFQYAATLGSCALCIVQSAFPGDRRNTLSVPRAVQMAKLIAPHFDPLVKTIQHNAPYDKPKYSGKVIAPLVLLRSKHPRAADAFALSFGTMEDLGKTSPVLAFDRFLKREVTFRSGHEAQKAVFKAGATALWAYCNNENVEIIRGNDDHVDWLLKLSKPFLTELGKNVGFPTT